MFKNSGQSTIEFLLTFVFSFAFITVFVQQALNAGQGYIVHYMTYMASRTYLVYDNNNLALDATLASSEGVIRRNIIEGFRPGELGLNQDEILQSIKFNSPNDFAKKYEYVGVLAKFTRKMNPLSVIGGPITLNFLSESFIGKEPTRGTCLRRLCDFVIGQHLGFECQLGAQNEHLTVYDNGC